MSDDMANYMVKPARMSAVALAAAVALVTDVPCGHRQRAAKPQRTAKDKRKRQMSKASRKRNR